jgi:ubiquinol-cytochrome c reductase cytochrome b subunit
VSTTDRPTAAAEPTDTLDRTGSSEVEASAHEHHRRHHEHVPARTKGARVARWFDARVGGARIGRGALKKIFPNHWSFLLGEVALYSFLVLIITGIYLTFFYTPNTDITTYQGSYAPLQGVEMSNAFASGLDITFDVRAGLFVRQVHHWAALVFLGAIALHLARVFFTGAFRRPREVNWVIGCTLMLLALGNGFAGYSLLDDQLSGTGLRIAYSVLISIPFIGPWLASLLFGGNFPGDDIIGRLFVLHILVLPVILGILITVHLTILIKHKHTHFPGKGARDDNVVGERLWPTYTFKAAGLFFIVAAILGLLGGVAQINPIWLYGPFEPANVSSASQPDWYLGWLIGALRIMPNWEIVIGGWHVVPNPFFGGVLFPLIVFGVLWMWPTVERLLTGDDAEHSLLDRPRDRPWRTAVGAAMVAWVALMFFFGAADRLLVQMGISYEAQLIVARVLVFALPAAVFLVVKRGCEELRRAEPPEPAATDGSSDPSPAAARR